MFYGGRGVRTIGAKWHRVLDFDNSVLLMTFSPENVNGWSLSVSFCTRPLKDRSNNGVLSDEKNALPNLCDLQTVRLIRYSLLHVSARPIADVDDSLAERSAVMENAMDDVHGGVSWLQMGPQPIPKLSMLPHPSKILVENMILCWWNLIGLVLTWGHLKSISFHLHCLCHD